MIKINYNEVNYPISVLDDDKELDWEPYDEEYIHITCDIEDVITYFKEGFPEQIKFY